MLLGVDVGGTFTDAVLATADGLATAKVPTTPADQSEGVLAAVRAALRKAGAEPGDVERFAHGMTVATNALLEGTAARTALLATEGFTDVVALGRQARADLYRLCAAHPAPLVPDELRFGVSERMGPDGVLRELTGEEELARRVLDAGVEAVAVVLLHSYRHPEHERALGAALGEGVHVSLSHEVTGTFREYERAATTEIDAALSPLLGRYLRSLSTSASEAGLPEPAIMQSNGGLIDAAAAASHAAFTVLSGPAGGTVGAAYAARAAGVEDALCFDMGGTSCDVCVVDGGAVRETAGREVGGRPLALPMLDVHTVGAGGGSIAWGDAGGALRVGPRSAGAEPGPACYGRGGTEPTVTDANLLLGRLAGDLAGDVSLDVSAADAAVGGLAEALGLDPVACAEGIVRVANAEMVRALRVMTVERGVDPRRYALLAFGGAGPLHAVAIATELGIGRVVCPRASGVLSALGLVVSPRRRDVQRSVLLAGEALTAAALREVVGELAAEARAAVGEDAEVASVHELRYRGQAFELPVGAGERPDPDELREAFAAAHEERYGYRDDEAEVELVTVRVTARVPGPAPDLARQRGQTPLSRQRGLTPLSSRRRVVFAGEEHDAEVLRGDLASGTELSGPAICELPESTVAVPPGWQGRVDDSGAVILWTP